MQVDGEALSPRKRGRPASETPAQLVERLERQLQLARAAAKEKEHEDAAVVGFAVLEEIQTDSELKARLADILRRRVTGNGAKARVAGLLVSGG
jgi:hypothetical protein